MSGTEGVSPRELQQLMRSRRSVRRFRTDPVPRERIEQLVAAAITAPSASNLQPWRFWAITDRGLLGAAAEEVRRAVEAIAARLEGPAAEALSSYGRYFTRFAGAPVVLAVLGRDARLLSALAGERLPEEYAASVAGLEHESGLMSVSLALQNLLLMAHATGLGACIMTGPTLVREALERTLGAPPPWRLLALVPVGFPDESPEETPRKPVEKVLRWRE